jgi:hypothetical protein
LPVAFPGGALAHKVGAGVETGHKV